MASQEGQGEDTSRKQKHKFSDDEIAILIEERIVKSDKHFGKCDGPDRADPHNIPAGADASWADPDVSPGSTNEVRSSPSPREPGRSKSQVAQQRRETAGVRKRIGSVGTASTEDAEDEFGRFARIQEPRGLLVPSAPLKCGTGEKTRTAAVPTRDKESRLREAEL
ncbi:hypothetical protein NDU88_004990 [Pleurodeles waltl]|uniref:Uncharacterized protein n=1 Tax=Pleurodeles waltl TaxID=8319 RepID=A0AAV7RJQ0_PLEWA|nr:hypothetical protein NDU88_004990 [Pleurodeles waltl]